MCKTHAGLDCVTRASARCDLIVEIKRAALGFHPREGRQDCSCDHEQGRAAFKGERGASALTQREQATLLATQVFFERGRPFAEAFGRQLAVLASVGVTLAIVLEQRLEQRLDASLARAVFICRAKVRGNLVVLFLAELERLRPSLAPHTTNVSAEHLGFDARNCRFRS